MPRKSPNINCQCYRNGNCLHHSAPRRWFGKPECVLLDAPKDPRTKEGCALQYEYPRPDAPLRPPKEVQNDPHLDQPIQNLVANAARAKLKGSTVFVTHLCCNACARMLINAGVSAVYCDNGKTSMPPEAFDVAVQMFKEAGVKLVVEGKDVM